jgi:CrcB protein
LSKYLIVGLGGAIGAIARFWLSALIGERLPARFPLGTLAINVSGSFIVGFFMTLVTERVNIHPNWRLGVAVGFVGAYTTFSTFEYETFRLLETGSGLGALANVLVSLILGFLAVWGGIALARELGTPTAVGDGVLSRTRSAAVFKPPGWDNRDFKTAPLVMQPDEDVGGLPGSSNLD